METQKFELEDAHLKFARELNEEAWNLLEKNGRTTAEDARMLCAAYAACYHWLQAGTPVQQQRSEWLAARVQTELKNTEMALYHAQRCLELTACYQDQMADFDLPFAYECMARANALAGKKAEAFMFIEKAIQVGELIRDYEDAKIFYDEFQGGSWFGVV